MIHTELFSCTYVFFENRILVAEKFHNRLAGRAQSPTPLLAVYILPGGVGDAQLGLVKHWVFVEDFGGVELLFRIATSAAGRIWIMVSKP
jgi:hypothetical protein